MLLAHVGDTHLSERDKHMTLEEQVELLQWIGNHAAEQGAELMLHGGDVFDKMSTPLERIAAIEVVGSWAQHFPVVITQGNHDGRNDLAYLSYIRSAHQVHVVERPEVLDVAGARVACLPWPRKAWLMRQMANASLTEINQAVTDALKLLLQGFRQQLAEHEGPRIVLGHVELGGASLDSGQPVAGHCDVNLHEGDLVDVGADIACLSHIHLHQVLGGGKIVYAGAPRPTRFGEEAPKGYCLIDVSDDPPAIQHVRAPYRELITVDAEWISTSLTGDGGGIQEVNEFDLGLGGSSAPPNISGSCVRLRYEVQESERKPALRRAEEIRAEWLAQGAQSVTIDPRVRAVSRVRSEAIRTATTLRERVEAWWTTTGQRPERADAILAKLGELETDTSDKGVHHEAA